MSDTNQDPLVRAEQAERELNSQYAKTGKGMASDSADESAVNEGVETRFPGAKVTYGSAASGAGDNRDIPESEGGGEVKVGPVRRQAKAGDFEGTGGPEDKEEEARRVRGGDDEVPGNVRQGGSGGGSGDGRVRVSGASDGFD